MDAVRTISHSLTPFPAAAMAVTAGPVHSAAPERVRLGRPNVRARPHSNLLLSLRMFPHPQYRCLSEHLSRQFQFLKRYIRHRELRRRVIGARLQTRRLLPKAMFTISRITRAASLHPRKQGALCSNNALRDPWRRVSPRRDCLNTPRPRMSSYYFRSLLSSS
ncbi:hypothetical protein B0H21DRAFT_359789 [Amylocystis lapponica]|nr:hypothetical protein B0H21DRAFT_359789 [Amylocystis lapponica]